MYFLLFLSLVIASLLTSKSSPTGGKPWCSPQNLYLPNASEGNFFLLPDGTFEYGFPHCKMRRFNVDTTAKCLERTHIVFMGDSLSRYFYLSLAHLLAKKKWADKFARLPAHPNVPRSILSEKDYQNWSLFYHESNKLLTNGKDTFEICDCYRNDSRPWISPSSDKTRRNHQQINCRENRHFRYTPNGDLDDQNSDVRLSYIQWYGHMPMRGNTAYSHYPRNHTFSTFVNSLNKYICKAQPNAEIPPATLQVASTNVSTHNKHLFDHIAPPDLTSSSLTFHPLAHACAWTRNDYGANNFPSFSYPIDCTNFPQEILPKCQQFERTILGPLDTTHVILNIGWHSGLHRFQPPLLTKVLDAADKYFAYPGPSQTLSSSLQPQQSKVLKQDGYWGKLYLPKVTWRSATYDAVFQLHDRLAKTMAEEVGAQKLAFFEVYQMTKQLREIHRLIEAKDNVGLRRMVKVHPAYWPAEREVNYTTIQTTFVDTAHLEPWAYTEIHQVFLNAVCPLEEGMT